jgi:hypothetical protein
LKLKLCPFEVNCCYLIQILFKFKWENQFALRPMGSLLRLLQLGPQGIINPGD